jgi:hypothetical protein
MQFPEISASMSALKALKHEGKPLTGREVNAILDQMIELFNLKSAYERPPRIMRSGMSNEIERQIN